MDADYLSNKSYFLFSNLVDLVIARVALETCFTRYPQKMYFLGLRRKNTTNLHNFFADAYHERL